jgi:hypothetical protein
MVSEPRFHGLGFAIKPAKRPSNSRLNLGAGGCTTVKVGKLPT